MTQKTDEELAAEFQAVWSDPTRFTERHEAPAFERLVDATEKADAATAELVHAVQAARDEGYSWTTIGYALGVSRQAARTRFGTPKTEQRAATQRTRPRSAA